MDRAHRNLMRIHEVSGWLLDHAKYLPKNLYRMTKKDEVIQYIPVDIFEELSELVRQDLANIVTPMQVWRDIGKDEDFGEINKK